MGTGSIENVIDEEVECVFLSASHAELITEEEQPLDLKKLKQKISPLIIESSELEVIFESVIKETKLKQQGRTKGKAELRCDDVKMKSEMETFVNRSKPKSTRTPTVKQDNLKLVKRQKTINKCSIKKQPQQQTKKSISTSCGKPQKRQKQTKNADPKTVDSLKDQLKFSQKKRANSEVAEKTSHPDSSNGFQNHPATKAASLSFPNEFLTPSEGAAHPRDCGYPNCARMFRLWKELFVHMLCDHNCNTAFGVLTCINCTSVFRFLLPMPWRMTRNMDAETFCTRHLRFSNS